MSKKKRSIPAKYQAWVDARRQFRLSHHHIQMARELGLNPKKLGGIANHNQERWKAPLPEFIEDLYFKRFGRILPEVVMTIEQMVDRKRLKSQNRVKPKALSDDEESKDEEEPEYPF